MTTSGQYNFNPALGSLALSAFARIQVRPTEVTTRHLRDAQQESNFLFSELSNLQPNLWTVGLTTQVLTQGTATYSVAAETSMILDVYINNGTSDYIISPISRTDYASYPDKTLQSTPTVFWYDRLIAQTITLWPVPDASATYTMNYYSCRQVQDANYINGQNVELPHRFFDVFVSGLAYRLARIYRPEQEQLRSADYQRAWDIAARFDTENVNLYIFPGLGAYYG
jgi:hypothetical protein